MFFFFLLWAIAPVEVFASWFQVQAQCFKLAGHISDLARKVVLHLESSLSETSEGYPGAQQKGGGPCLMVALKFCLFLVSRFPLLLDWTWGSHSFPPRRPVLPVPLPPALLPAVDDVIHVVLCGQSGRLGLRRVIPEIRIGAGRPTKGKEGGLVL